MLGRMSHEPERTLGDNTGSRTRLRTAAYTLLLAVAFTACTSDGPLFPAVPSGDLVMLPGAGNASLSVVDVRAGRLVRRVLKEDFFTAQALTADGRTMYGWVCECRPGSGVHREEMIAVDIASGSISWRLPMRVQSNPSVIDGIGLYGGEDMAVSHDGTTVYVGYAKVDTVFGIAAVDVATRRPVAFSGPWNLQVAAAFTALPPSTTLPEGALLVVGVPGAPGPLREHAAAYLLHPRSLALIDSISADAVGRQALWHIVLTPDPNTIYLRGSRDLMRFDLSTRTVTAHMASASAGLISYMPGFRQLMLTDAGAHHLSPGAGLLHLYTDDLLPIGTVDVATPLGLSSLNTGFAVQGSDPRYAYVKSGAGGLIVQPSRLLVVDLLERRLVGAIELGGPPGLGRIYPLY